MPASRSRLNTGGQSTGWRPIREPSPGSVLVVEDDEALAAGLVKALEREGYAVAHVTHGQRALTRLGRPGAVDLVILDLGLPDMDGLDVCVQARASGYAGAIVILTGRVSELDLVVGLDAGADDYLGKPFALAELLARVRALRRRTVSSAPAATEGELRVDFASHRVHAGEVEIPLTAKEFGVLAVLAGASGRVVSRERLIAEVWDAHWHGSAKVIDVTVGRLRHKLDAAGAAERIVTVRGVGFRLERD